MKKGRSESRCRRRSVQKRKTKQTTKGEPCCFWLRNLKRQLEDLFGDGQMQLEAEDVVEVEVQRSVEKVEMADCKMPSRKGGWTERRFFF